jgi:GDPmannose 4,6-dehydratase
MRPAEVDLLVGDPGKAKEKLGWKPKVSFAELVKMMVDSDIKGIQCARY